MRFSPQQDCALCAAGRWLRAPGAQVFRLFGYAGTGKTTLAKHIREHYSKALQAMRAAQKRKRADA